MEFIIVFSSIMIIAMARAIFTPINRVSPI